MAASDAQRIDHLTIHSFIHRHYMINFNLHRYNKQLYRHAQMRARAHARFLRPSSISNSHFGHCAAASMCQTKSKLNAMASSLFAPCCSGFRIHSCATNMCVCVLKKSCFVYCVHSVCRFRGELVGATNGVWERDGHRDGRQETIYIYMKPDYHRINMSNFDVPKLNGNDVMPEHFIPITSRTHCKSFIWNATPHAIQIDPSVIIDFSSNVHVVVVPHDATAVASDVVCNEILCQWWWQWWWWCVELHQYCHSHMQR